MVGMCFPMGMASLLMLDMGGNPWPTCGPMPHHYYLGQFGYIPNGFVSIGVAGAVYLSRFLNLSKIAVMIGQGAISSAILLKINLSGWLLTYAHPNDGVLAFVVVSCAYCLGTWLVCRKDKTRPSRLLNSPYPAWTADQI